MRARSRRPGRGAALAQGLGLLTWAIGDLAWTLESRPGATPSTPSVADGFYLLIYPLAYLGIMLIIRSEVRRFRASTWLDGLVAGLGAAALCAAFVIDPILGSASGSVAVVTADLAYPIGDLLLLTLAVGALVIVPLWPRRQVVLVSGCLVMAVGATVYPFQSVGGSYRPVTLLDATWVAALLMVSVTVWQPVGTWRAHQQDTQPNLLLPGVAAAVSVMILIVGNWVHVSRVAVGLTIATLAAVVFRTVLAHRELGALTPTVHLQASTDDLTGLSNRRQLMATLNRHFADGAGVDGSGHTIALLMADLDHFKEINDSFGHPTGDWLLRQIGPRLAEVTRSDDLVARLGGDEFATGFSSLAHLSDLALRELKIDRMLTGRLSVDGSDGRDEAIIRSSIELGHSLGLRVVAEGVGRTDHFKFLASAGCDVAQGYVISFPQPPEALDLDAIDRASGPLLKRPAPSATAGLAVLRG